MSDALIAVLVVAAFIGLFLWAGLSSWALTFGFIAGVVALSEGISVWRTGRSLSQRFWAWRHEHPVKAWVIMVALAGAWLGLLVHLMWK